MADFAFSVFGIKMAPANSLIIGCTVVHPYMRVAGVGLRVHGFTPMAIQISPLRG